MRRTLCPLTRNVFRLIVVACLGELVASALAQTIVWTDERGQRIQARDVNGGDIQTLAQFPPTQAAYQIRYDPLAAKLYYRFFDGAMTVFQRANPDGSEPETITTPTGGPFAINIDLRKLHWRNSSTLYSSDLDGAGVESHTYPVCCLTPFLAVGDELFLGGTNGVIKGIWRADLDGSNEALVQMSGPPLGAAYDPVEDRIYWIAFGQGILRMKRDGTGFQQIYSNGPFSDGDQIVVDTRGRKTYWTDTELKVVRRSNLDGSNVEDFVTASDAGNSNLSLQGLTIVEPPWIPTVSDWGTAAMAFLVLCSGLILLRQRMGTIQ